MRSFQLWLSLIFEGDLDTNKIIVLSLKEGAAKTYKPMRLL
jgi:hypothetical protein